MRASNELQLRDPKTGQTVTVTADPDRQTSAPVAREAAATPEVIVYSHSPILYWWPVWLMGFIMAGITYASGEVHALGPAGERVWFHASSNLGVIFLLTLFLVVLLTNVTVRGLASAIAILSIALAVVTLAYLRLWDTVLNWFGDLKVHLDLGAYFWFSTLVFLVWAATIFVFDRLTYWRIKPGQITEESVFGASAKSYDTENMVLEKHRDDVFRHWFLGMGSGDLHIRPYGNQVESIEVPNVLFIGSKIRRIEHLIASQSEEPA